jgi:RNA polymerase sigma-70 factor, ECF subfamily
VDIDLFSRPQTRVEDFEAAAMPHLAALYRTAKFLAYEPAEAEDLVQEVYLEAWKSFHRFEPGTNCRAWLFSILFHRLHHHRRRQLRSSKVDSFPDPAEADTLPATPPVPQDLRDEDILQALAKLPHDFREVVLMADVQEFSYKEVAATLSIPLGTVMSRLSRARKLLRQQLAQVARSYGIRAANEGESA